MQRVELKGGKHIDTQKINEGASETIRLGQDRVVDREQAGEGEEERRKR